MFSFIPSLGTFTSFPPFSNIVHNGFKIVADFPQFSEELAIIYL